MHVVMSRYVHATFTAEDGVIDDVEFLFSDPLSDATVCIRAASRALDYDDYGRNRKRLEQIRLALNWDEVGCSFHTISQLPRSFQQHS